MTKITVDFETQSAVNLKKAGAFEYSVDSSTRALCLGIKQKGFKTYLLDFHQMQRPFKKLPQNFQNKWREWILNPAVFNAHNAYFEQCIYNNILVERLGWPNIPPMKWRCTAAKAAAVAIPRNLADAGAVMGLRVQKDFEGHKVMMKLCKPTAAWVKWKKQFDKLAERGLPVLHHSFEPPKFWTPETAPEDFQKLYHYCRVDLITEELLDEALPDLVPSEQKLWFLDQRINLRGVQTDKPLIEKISRIMASESKRMNKELDALTMGLVSSGNAREAILDFLWLEEIPVPDLKAKTVDDFLNNGKVSGDAKELLKLRRALSKASTAKYQKFLIQAASDGRVRDIMLFHGASTGRWSGKGIQPQNFPRGIVKDIWEAIERIKTCDLEELKMLYGENLMPLFSSVLRGMFTATPGNELFVEDLNAIECRVLWWLANHQAGLDMFRNNLDPYVAMACAIFNCSPLEVTDEMRQVGKAAVLGCGYQMGFKKFITAAYDVYRAKVTKEMAKVSVTEYRKQHWPVVELWDNYNQASILAIKKPGKVFKTGRCKFFVKDSFLWIELPSGRRLAYKDPSVVTEDVYIEGEGEIVGTTHVEGYGEVNLREDTKIFPAEKIRYWAVNMKAKKTDTAIPKWSREATYGGKLCIAGGTLVCTNRGWVEIENVKATDKVWDGIEWVSNGGAIYNGNKKVIEAYGAEMTPDHLVLSEKGWICASQSKKYNRLSCRVPNGFEIFGKRREKIIVGCSVRLPEENNFARNRIEEMERPKNFGVLADAESPVFDLLNCGPRSRFVIWAGGAPLIVHNCENITQAVARDVLADAIVRAEKTGFGVLMHSHDEAVAEAPKGKFETVLDSKGVKYCPTYRKIIETPPGWGQDLPLKAGGWAGERYKKG